MALQACLNGARTRAEHPAVPISASELALDAAAAGRAGAFAVHLHPRDRNGAETLDARACDAAVAAIRAAAPRLAIGLSTSARIEPDPFARAAAVRGWRTPPDFVSVNLREVGWEGVVRAALHAGVGVEAGVARIEDATELAEGPFAHRVLRALVQAEGGAQDAAALADALPAGVGQLWHGYGPPTWEILAAATAAGHDARVGLEDVLVLADGSPAAGNAELLARAVELSARARPSEG